ncbi:MAG: hypothetical protein NC911_08515 [Candidatus Omnitrophica bacterium]|nr:hypothetical protein [Candidatus Omnitrophota bacterium]
MKASLSLTEPADSASLVTDIYQEKRLWDYPAWRMLCLADYFWYQADRDFVESPCHWVCRS